MSLFPLGIEHYLAGGVIIGIGVSLIYITTGIIAGASGFFSSTLAYFLDNEYFRQYKASRNWRLVFTIGLIAGAFLYTQTIGETFVTQVHWWRLAIGGFFVGIGTRLARGCTSGHGICGLSSLSIPSLIAVITFMTVAIITAIIVNTIGVLP